MKNLIFIFSFLFTTQVMANLSDKYDINPLRIEARSGQGKTLEFKIKVRNNMKKTRLEGYELVIKEFILKESDGSLDHHTKQVNPRSLVKFARFSKSKIDLGPEETETVKLIVSIPKDYKEGSGYLVYRFNKVDDSAKKSTNIQFNKQVYGFAAININENLNMETKVNEVNFYNDKLNVNIANTGNSYVKSSSKVVILEGTKKIGTFNLVDSKNREESLFLPDQKRDISTIIPSKLMKGKDLKASVIVSDVNNKYLKTEIIPITFKAPAAKVKPAKAKPKGKK